MTHKERKYINNLPKYDIGKMPTMSGYLVGQQADLSSFSSTPGYDYSNDIRSQRQANLLSGITQGASTINNIYLLLNNSKSTATTTAATTTSAFVDNTSGLLLFNPSTTGLGSTPLLAETAGATAAETGSNVSTSAASSAGSSALGTAAGILGSVIGTGMMVNDFLGFKNRLTDKEIMDSASRGTESKYGVTYNKYGGINANQIKQYTSALNTGGTISASLNGLGAGASLGTMIAPGWGTVIGGVAGGLTGLVGGLIGSNSRSSAVEKSIENAQIGMANANLQAEAEAGSKGLRHQFNIAHADKGKNITFNNGKVGDVRMVHTSHGIVPGIQFGLAGKGETIYNPNDGTASVYDEGLYRVDNIPTGVPLKGFNYGKDWGGTVILGNRTNPETGNTFAQDAKPFTRILEKYNKGKNDMTLGKKTALVNRKNAINALNHLSNVQMYTANCGKNKFDDGALFATLGGLNGLGYAISSKIAADNDSIYVPNTYVPYSGTMPVRRMVDYSQQVMNQRNANRQNIYNINQAGNIGSGMKLLLMSNSNIKGANAINNIYASQADKQNEIDNQYEDRRMLIDLNNMRYANEASKTRADMFAKANASKVARRDQANKFIYTNARQTLQDYNTYKNYKDMLNLYDMQIRNDIVNSKKV